MLVPNKRYDDPASVKRALDDVGGAANVMISRSAAHPEYEFRTLDAIATQQGITAVDLFIRIVKEGGASVIATSMIDEDIRRFYAQPWVMVASDGGIGMRHPRGAGTFPRVIGRYVRELGWLSLTEAVRKMTSAPAARLKLSDRGTIAEGKVADLVLFDPADRRPLHVPGAGVASDRGGEGLGHRDAGVGFRQANRGDTWCHAPRGPTIIVGNVSS